MNGDTEDQPPNYVFAPLPHDFQFRRTAQPPGLRSPTVREAAADAADAAAEARAPRRTTASFPTQPPAPPVGPSREHAPVSSSLADSEPLLPVSFSPLLRRWFDLDDDGMRAVLARIERGKDWVDAPFPGVRYLCFQAGPGAVARQAGCLRLTPGALFPHHLHHGRERSLILAGSLLLDGSVRNVGQVIEAPAGSMHDFVAGPKGDLILIVAHDGVSFSV